MNTEPRIELNSLDDQATAEEIPADKVVEASGYVDGKWVHYSRIKAGEVPKGLVIKEIPEDNAGQS